MRYGSGKKWQTMDTKTDLLQHYVGSHKTYEQKYWSFCAKVYDPTHIHRLLHNADTTVVVYT